MPSSITDAGPTSMWDLAQVEILRGPQATIQGENSLAGAIVLRTDDPSMDWNARARVILSDPGDRKLAFAGGGPLVQDELAFRVAVEDRDFDGFVINPTRSGREDALDSRLARAKLMWTPSSLPGLTARLGYTRSKREGPYSFTYSNKDVADFYDNRYNFSDAPNSGETSADVANLEIDYVLSDRWGLDAVTAWSDANVVRRYDGDLTAAPLSYGMSDQTTRTLSQEFRLNYDGDRLDGLVGLYFSRRKVDGFSRSLTNVNTPGTTIAGLLQANGLDAATAGFIASLYVGALPVIPVDYFSGSPTRSDNQAFFADGEFKLTDRLSLLGGFRYDRQEYTMAVTSTTRFTGTLPDPAAFGAPGSALHTIMGVLNQAVLGFVQQAAGSTPEDTRTFNTFLPKGGLRYEINDDLSASFIVQRGYRSGGSTFNIARSDAYSFNPEYTWNYEASLRSLWLDGALALNANLYYIDWKDKQVTAFFGLNDYDYHTVNAGRAHLYGFELEATHRLSEGFDWYGSLGYSRTQYDEFSTVIDAQINDYAGTEFAYAPHWTLSLGGNWRFADSWVANLNASYRGKLSPDIGQSQSWLGARTLVNAKLGYENMDWSAYVFANNLLDEQYMQYWWGEDRPSVILGAPRVVGIGFEARW
jgi:outer membrane receptor protein involved in Fe transport